jgi:uncharacterized protein (TIGR00730 family)
MARSLRVCVFCGASTGSDPQFAAAAAELGSSLARLGHQVIYGGSINGCMGKLADAVLASNGKIAGVLPTQLIETEQRHPGVADIEIVEHLAARKLRMFARSDVVIALPGGTGTLDELLEALTMKRLGLIAHPIILVDVGAFFAPLLAFLERMVTTGFAKDSQRDLMRVVPGVKPALEELARLG